VEELGGRGKGWQFERVSNLMPNLMPLPAASNNGTDAVAYNAADSGEGHWTGAERGKEK
jgi:hypothetical protein